MSKRPKRKPSTALARREPRALVLPPPTPEELANPVAMIQRWARDPLVSVEKLERLMAMQERIMAINAKAAFDTAFIEMRPLLPTLPQNGELTNKTGAVQSYYDKNEDTETILTPILHRFGFSLSYKTEWPAIGVLEVVGVLTHREGHTRESRFQATADNTGGKNFIQGLGSAVQYGHRYTRRDLLNLVAKKDPGDDGGAAAPSRRRESSRAPAAAAPPTHHDATQDEPISTKQRRRLFVLLGKAGRDETQFKAWLAVAYDLDSTKKIPRRLYDTICNAIEHPGPLPAPAAAREPGEEG